jgi:hypothetical protein
MSLKNKLAMGLMVSGGIIGAQYFADNEVSGCNIKGNISASGTHIYHMPSQDYYDETRIDFSKGERWFCSESEARGAGLVGECPGILADQTLEARNAAIGQNQRGHALQRPRIVE